MKLKTSIEDLVKMDMRSIKACVGSAAVNQNHKYNYEDEVPDEFVDFMSYCRDLKFDEKPDYNYLRRKFKDLFNRLGYEYDYVYDWMKLEKNNKKT